MADGWVTLNFICFNVSLVHSQKQTHESEYEHILHEQNHIALHSQPIIILCLDGKVRKHSSADPHAYAIASNVVAMLR